MQEAVTLIFLALLAFIGFAIYFFFKILQFVLQATNLYKDMVYRQDTIIKILKEIYEVNQTNNKENTDNKTMQKSSKKKENNLKSDIKFSEVNDILNKHFNNLNNVENAPFLNYFLVKHDDFQFAMVYIDDNKFPTIIADDELKSMPQLYTWYQDYFKE